MSAKRGPRITHGDRVLAEYATEQADKDWQVVLSEDPQIGAIRTTEMFAYNVYPLSDWSWWNASGGSGGLDHIPDKSARLIYIDLTARGDVPVASIEEAFEKADVSVLPAFDVVNAALNRRLETVLDECDRWLLQIPRVFVPGRSSPELVISPSGGAVVLFPMAASGTLHRWNEQLAATLLLSSPDETAMELLGATRFQRRPGRFARLSSFIFTGGKRPRGISEDDVSTFLLGARQWRKTSDAQFLRDTIWAFTVFQQAAMILHEFGHVKSINDGSELEGTTEQDRLHNEMMADEYAVVWLKRLAYSLMSVSPTWQLLASEALWFYFMILDIVNESRGSPANTRHLNARFLYMLEDFNAVQALINSNEMLAANNLDIQLEKIYQSVGGVARSDFVAHERAIFAERQVGRASRKGGRRDPDGLISVPQVLLARRRSIAYLRGNAVDLDLRSGWKRAMPFQQKHSPWPSWPLSFYDDLNWICQCSLCRSNL